MDPAASMDELRREDDTQQSAKRPKRKGVRKRPEGLLSQTAKRLRNAVSLDRDGKVVAANKDKLIQSFEEFAAVLDKLGGIGSFVSGNLKKFKKSKAASADDYGEWLQNELPVHAAKQYKDVADPSAAVANMWVGWILEFFVECFANIHEGQETAESIDDAYKRTLSEHHNYLMRKAFLAGVGGQMPDRQHFLELLRGGSTDGGNGSPAIEDPIAIQEIGEFVEIGRQVVHYMKAMNDEVFKSLEAEREKQSKSSGSGRGAPSFQDPHLYINFEDLLPRLQLIRNITGYSDEESLSVEDPDKQLQGHILRRFQVVGGSTFVVALIGAAWAWFNAFLNDHELDSDTQHVLIAQTNKVIEYAYKERALNHTAPGEAPSAPGAPAAATQVATPATPTATVTAAPATPQAPAATATPEAPAAITTTPEAPPPIATPEAPAAIATAEAPAATATSAAPTPDSGPDKNQDT